MTCNKFEKQVKGVIQEDSITVGERHGYVRPIRCSGKSKRVCLCFPMW